MPTLKTPDVNKQKEKTFKPKTNTDHHNGDLNVRFLCVYVLLILNG